MLSLLSLAGLVISIVFAFVQLDRQGKRKSEEVRRLKITGEERNAKSADSCKQIQGQVVAADPNNPTTFSFVATSPTSVELARLRLKRHEFRALLQGNVGWHLAMGGIASTSGALAPVVSLSSLEMFFKFEIRQGHRTMYCIRQTAVLGSTPVFAEDTASLLHLLHGTDDDEEFCLTAELDMSTTGNSSMDVGEKAKQTLVGSTMARTGQSAVAIATMTASFYPVTFVSIS